MSIEDQNIEDEKLELQEQEKTDRGNDAILLAFHQEQEREENAKSDLVNEVQDSNKTEVEVNETLNSSSIEEHNQDVNENNNNQEILKSKETQESHVVQKNDIQGKEFEAFVEQILEEQGFHVEMRQKNQEVTEKGVTYPDGFLFKPEIDENTVAQEAAIIEVKSGRNDNSEQTERLITLAEKKDIPLIFVTPNGSKESYQQDFSPKVREQLESANIPVYVVDVTRLDSVFRVDKAEKNSVAFFQDLSSETPSQDDVKQSQETSNPKKQKEAHEVRWDDNKY